MIEGSSAICEVLASWQSTPPRSRSIEGCREISRKVSRLLLLIAALNVAIATSPIFAQQSPASFHWPKGKGFALSLTFDDARASQIDVVMPLLKKHDVKATFFIVPSFVEQRLNGWKKAVAEGQEIGNHSMSHPCTVNYQWSIANALEDYSLERMRTDLLDADKWIKEQLGTTVNIFAYPCGQTFVGRGQQTQSYVPLIADMFAAGRTFDPHSEPLIATSFDPFHSDLSQVIGIEMDTKDLEQLLPLLKQAAKTHTWVVLVGHEVGPSGVQVTRPAMLEKLIRYAQAPQNAVWLAPFGEVAKYVREQRKTKR
jgi:peptidoglycan/xylan/chitin deacetylase (PgdA/CDA1 family)